MNALRLVLAATLFAGCSSTNDTSEPPSDGGAAHASIPPGIDAAGDEASTFTLPDAGDAGLGSCGSLKNGEVLEQGTDFNSACDEVDFCENGSLQPVHPAASGSGSDGGVTCPTPACSGDEDAGPPAGPCTVNSLCAFPRSYCLCTDTGDGGTMYKCQPVDSQCPAGRPRYGASCGADAGAPEGTTCIYETCSDFDLLNDLETCKDGVWQLAQIEDVCGP